MSTYKEHEERYKTEGKYVDNGIFPAAFAQVGQVISTCEHGYAIVACNMGGVVAVAVTESGTLRLTLSDRGEKTFHMRPVIRSKHFDCDEPEIDEVAEAARVAADKAFGDAHPDFKCESDCSNCERGATCDASYARDDIKETQSDVDMRNEKEAFMREYPNGAVSSIASDEGVTCNYLGDLIQHGALLDKLDVSPAFEKCDADDGLNILDEVWDIFLDYYDDMVQKEKEVSLLMLATLDKPVRADDGSYADINKAERLFSLHIKNTWRFYYRKKSGKFFVACFIPKEGVSVNILKEDVAAKHAEKALEQGAIKKSVYEKYFGESAGKKTPLGATIPVSLKKALDSVDVTVESLLERGISAAESLSAFKRYSSADEPITRSEQEERDKDYPVAAITARDIDRIARYASLVMTYGKRLVSENRYGGDFARSVTVIADNLSSLISGMFEKFKQDESAPLRAASASDDIGKITSRVSEQLADLNAISAKCADTISKLTDYRCLTDIEDNQACAHTVRNFLQHTLADEDFDGVLDADALFFIESLCQEWLYTHTAD